MYEVIYTGQFKKSLKLCVRRGLKIEDFIVVLDILQEKGALPPEYLPHKLRGKYKGCWECHINPDWLLIWQHNDRELRLILVDTGTHSDLF
ncbi:MAG: type II toxin-antitoxin system YafQ family toxin [Bacteroidaceae bacterium]|nr:type II toxin-antitoxin system YafQ family toxin [Bacteroidaceae bacterium]